MNLTTPEKFLLIAHHPEKGRFIIQELQLKFGLIGALLLDMSLDDKIIIENDKLILKNRGRDENQIISEISLLISNSNKPRKIKYWVGKIARKSGKYKWAILNDLVRKKMIRIERKTFLGIIPYRRTYITDDRTRRDLIRTAKSNILHHDNLNDENVAQLGLIEACKMQRILASDKGELKRIKKELKTIIKESPIAESVSKTISEVQAAILAAIVVTTAASASASSH